MSHHFAWLLLNHSIQPQLLHARPIQNTDRYSRQEPENTQERACTHKTDACVSNIPRMPNPRFSCCMLCFLPPHSVHWMPYWDSNLCVRKKFRTEPNREKARVSPNARASSFPRNQNAVIRFWTTEKARETHEIQCSFLIGAFFMGVFVKSLAMTALVYWASKESEKVHFCAVGYFGDFVEFTILMRINSQRKWILKMFYILWHFWTR